MNNENTKNVEFTNSKIIDTLSQISNEYSVPFDFLINFAALNLIDDVNLLRLIRTGTLNLDSLSENILS